MPVPLPRRRRWCRLPWMLVWVAIANFCLLLYLMFMQRLLPNHSRQLADRVQLFTDDVTFIFREFEDFENEIADSVKALQTTVPNAHIVIIADALPYPPLKLPQGVNLVLLNLIPTQTLLQSRPENYIKTKYSIIVPDAVALGRAEAISWVIKDFEEQHSLLENNIRASVYPTDPHAHLHCVGLEVSYKQWTAKYSPTRDKICDSVTGSQFIIVIKTSDLFELSEPFSRPLHQMFFLQTALREWKISIGNQTVFKQTRQLFQDAHLSWKHRTREHARIKTGYARLGMKLVALEDGTEEWFGACTKQSNRCFGTVVDLMPEYINQGQWTPPCCLRALRVCARHVFRVLEGSGVRYWLEGGSLLGAVRSHDIIPWDYDVDIGIYLSDISKSFHLSSAQAGRYEDEDGFLWEKASEGDFYRVQYSATNHLHVDIFPFYPKDGNMTKNTWFQTHRQDMPFPEKYLLLMEKLTFVGHETSVPNHYREFLEMKFGKGVIENPKYPNDIPAV